MLHQVHRVSQALAAGVREDEELEADLAPRALPVVVDPEPVGTDTAPDPLDTGEDAFDVAGFAAMMAPGAAAAAADGREHTTAMDRTPTAEREIVRPDPPLPDLVEPELPPRRSRPRRSKRGPIILLLALLLVAGAGLGAWWYGWARYTSTPGVIGIGQVGRGRTARRRRTRGGARRARPTPRPWTPAA